MKILKNLTLLILILNLFSPIKIQAFSTEHETETNSFSEKTNPLSYKYRTEVCSYLEEGFELPKKINNIAKGINAPLNNSMFFDVPFLLDSRRVRKYLLKPKYYKPDVGKTILVETEDSNIVECAYFDRKSDKLLIVGGGFTNEKELMAPFLHMFPNYDIVIFDYRGHGIHDGKYLNPATWRINPAHRIFNVNIRKTRLGGEEEKDVTAVVNHFRNTKNYNQVYGLGICYSALIFIKAQSIWQKENNQKLFDKIIIDGCWLSLKKFITKLSQDLKLLCSPQYGGWKKTWLHKQSWFQKGIFGLANIVFNVDIDTVSILPHLDGINIPILYFYGKNDLVVTREEFETIWNKLDTEKTAIITSNPHVRNHIKEKEFYKLACDLFLELPHKEFISCLRDEKALKQHYINKIELF